MESFQIASIVILILSVVIHEMAHAYTANWLGDPTARLQGRLSPNPLIHLDPLMSVILPGLLILSGSPILFGAAKPVPYNPYNFRDQKWGETLVAAAGPASNIALAIIFAVIIRVNDQLNLVSDTFVTLAGSVIVINIFLALFNLLPIPPLDGSKILPSFLPYSLRLSYERFRSFFENNPFLGFGLVIVLFILFFSGPLVILTYFLTGFLVG